MPWPAHIVAKASHMVDTQGIENLFYGFYDSVLNECFPPNQFTVTPYYATAEAQTGSAGAIEFTITYVVEPLNLETPVFFLEIMPPVDLSNAYCRQAAYKQIRTDFQRLYHLIRVPKLYGVSAMGKQLSYHTFEKANDSIKPAPLPGSPTRIVDTVPIDRWDTNILEEDGRAKFLAVVEEIKEMVLNL